ncbi:hypothetical protein SKAU_G00169260 [Synaphobranchus kaupii]|uniref:T-complex 11 n=1 Tax=Synaphobranchus kaupii TaxID=118154 RepID=A0A9Q1FK79_SYNKA|nr:hypothetical protein SKAU_G00169260 [Synaphobranchus kaupii]
MPKSDTWPGDVAVETLGGMDSAGSCDSVVSIHSGFSDDSMEQLSAEERECILFLEEMIESLEADEDSNPSSNEPELKLIPGNQAAKSAHLSASLSGSTSKHLPDGPKGEEGSDHKSIQGYLVSTPLVMGSQPNVEAGMDPPATVSPHPLSGEIGLCPRQDTMATDGKEECHDHPKNGSSRGPLSYGGLLELRMKPSLKKHPESFSSGIKERAKPSPTILSEGSQSTRPSDSTSQHALLHTTPKPKVTPPMVAPKPKKLPPSIALTTEKAPVPNPDASSNCLGTSHKERVIMDPQRVRREALHKLGLLQDRGAVAQTPPAAMSRPRSRSELPAVPSTRHPQLVGVKSVTLERSAVSLDCYWHNPAAPSSKPRPRSRTTSLGHRKDLKDHPQPDTMAKPASQKTLFPTGSSTVTAPWNQSAQTRTAQFQKCSCPRSSDKSIMPNVNNVDGTDSDTPSEIPKLQTPESPSGSPPRQTCLLDTTQMENRLSNLTLAHEIVVNRDFCFKQSTPPEDSLEGRVKEIVHRAFWDSLRAQLSLTPPDYTHAVTLLQEVREILQSLLLPGHTRLRAQLEEVLDLVLIQQQAEHGALDLHRLGGYIIGTMASLCAPVRDPEIRKLRNLSDPVDLLREIMRVLGLMKVDMVNFTVQSLRPHLLQQAVQYERAKFQELLDQKQVSLANTTAWLQGAVLDASPVGSCSESPKQDVTKPTGGSLHSPCPVSPSAVLNRGYFLLLSWDPDNQLYPESVVMDQARLEALGQKLHLLVLEASVLLVTSMQCGGAVFSVPGFVGNLKQTITALLEGSHQRGFDQQGALLALGEKLHKQVGEVLNAQGDVVLTPGLESPLKGQISGLAQDHNPVRSLIGSRIESYLLAVLGSPDSHRGPAVPPALAMVAPELKELAGAFRSIVNFNRMVFGTYYSSILRKLLFSEQGVEMGVDSR